MLKCTPTRRGALIVGASSLCSAHLGFLITDCREWLGDTSPGDKGFHRAHPLCDIFVALCGRRVVAGGDAGELPLALARHLREFECESQLHLRASEGLVAFESELRESHVADPAIVVDCFTFGRLDTDETRWVGGVHRGNALPELGGGRQPRVE